MKKNCLLLILVFVVSLAFAKENIVFTPKAFEADTVKAFADDLFLNGFLEEAAGEYRRYLFCSDDIDVSAVFALVDIYNIKKNSEGIIWLGENISYKLDKKSEYRLRLLQGKALFKKENLEKYKLYEEEVKDKITFNENVLSVLLPVSDFILQENIASASDILKTNSIKKENFTTLETLCSGYKKKSSVVAVLLSAVVPGAGRWYTGSLWGGVSSLFSIAALASTSIYTGNYYGWDNWRPWTLAGMAVFSYTVELYGAGKSATRYNNAKYNEIVTEVGNVYDSLY